MTTRPLVEASPLLERMLTVHAPIATLYEEAEIKHETVQVKTRDGVSLATDLFLPPKLPGPVIVTRTPYGRTRSRPTMLNFARCGYVVVSQDCRGTGDSEPDSWDYYIYEKDDSFDCVEWLSQQNWCDGYIGGCGSSYLAQTQWAMSFHPAMTGIAPEVGGIGAAYRTMRKHLFYNTYARRMGRGAVSPTMSHADLEQLMLGETLASGFFCGALEQPLAPALVERDPLLETMSFSDAQRKLWRDYCAMSGAERAALIKAATGDANVSILTVERLAQIFGHIHGHDAHSLATETPREICRKLHAPALLITGWYDWSLDDPLTSWALLMNEAPVHVREGSRLIITPSAHNAPGYHEGSDSHPELSRHFRTDDIADLLLAWHHVVRTDDYSAWPKVMYYLMGANTWMASDAWPPREAVQRELFLHEDRSLRLSAPQTPSSSLSYTFNPDDPTPTVGGAIVSNAYVVGSVDVSTVQRRKDVLAFTTAPLQQDLDVVGPLRLILHASSSACDTDFCARLSDLGPDGRAIQIQTGALRARFRSDPPAWLDGEEIYRFDIDMWATAHRFVAGHAIRLDISSADFPRFDRNSNRGADDGPPISAIQTIFCDADRPSCLVLSVFGDSANAFARETRS